MQVKLVHVQVKPEHVEAFLAATRDNHEGSIREPGNLRFDVMQSADDPNRFVLVEIFRDDAASAAHRDTAHYQKWSREVADWMASQRRSEIWELRAPATLERV